MRIHFHQGWNDERTHLVSVHYRAGRTYEMDAETAARAIAAGRGRPVDAGPQKAPEPIVPVEEDAAPEAYDAADPDPGDTGAAPVPDDPVPDEEE